MLTKHWKSWLLAMGLLVPTAALVAGCPTEEGDDDDSTPDVLPPEIIGVYPNPDDNEGLFYLVEPWVRFDIQPEGATLALADAAGTAVTGTVQTQENGRKLVFVPGGPLTADTEYVVTVTWNHPDNSPASFNFFTGPYGQPVGNEADLIGQIFHLDLSSATFVEPPAVGSLLQGFLADIYVLFNLIPESDLDSGVAHIEGALGMLDGPDIVQDMCEETIPFTLGADRAVGGGDDTEASWDNPIMNMEGELTISIQGVTATIRDLVLETVFHPELEDFAGGRFEGMLDTRDVGDLLGDDKGSICELVEKATGTGCIPCGDGQEFCLRVVAKDIVGSAISGGPLVSQTCADVIDTDLAGEAAAGSPEDDWMCKMSREDYMTKGEEGYPLCEAWVD